MSSPALVKLAVYIGPVPLNHRLGGQRQTKRLALELAIVSLSRLKVADVLFARCGDARI